MIRQAVSRDTAEVAAHYMRIMHDHYRPWFLFDDRQQSIGRYNDPLGESILAAVLSRVREQSGLDLLPTYSFSRIYLAGGRLGRHIDRPSCEVSGTLLLGSDRPWPIGVEVDGEKREVSLEPGDLMLYRGCEVPHWRDRYSGEFSAHVFLHFVEAAGRHAHLIYDEREGLGAPQTKRMPIRDASLEQRLHVDTLSASADANLKPNANADADADTSADADADANADADASANANANADAETDALPRVRRNEPCPCGRGAKYKHCHGRMR